MEQGVMTKNQAVCLMVLFLLGNSVIYGVNVSTGRDAWLALLAAAALAVPVLWVYSRILAACPGQDFFAILKLSLGKFGGAAATLLFVWYALHLAALLLRTMTEFVDANSLPNPPHMLFPAALLLACLYLLRKGLPVLGKWSVVILCIVLITLVFTGIFAIKDMNPRWLLPVLRREPEQFASGVFELATFPFLESVLLLPLLPRTGAGGRKPFRLLMWGLAISASLLLFVILRNILLLGEPMLQRQFFPSFSATKVITLGNFLTRLEASISIYLIFTSLTHLAVCLYVAALGVARLAGLGEVKTLVAPVGLLALMLSCFAAGSMMELTGFLATYPYYAAVFQILLPLVVWGGCLWKKRKG